MILIRASQTKEQPLEMYNIESVSFMIIFYLTTTAVTYVDDDLYVVDNVTSCTRPHIDYYQ